MSQQDDVRLWMKIDSVTKTADGSQVVTSDGTPQNKANIVLTALARVTKDYKVMEDEGADDVFIPSSSPSCSLPSCTDNLLPQEGSSCATVNNSSLTLSNGSPESTVAKANPDCLDWHCGERELMATQNDVDEVLDGTSETSKNCTTNNNDESTQPIRQDQTSMEAVETLEVLDQDITAGDKGLKKELKDGVILNEEQTDPTANKPTVSKIQQILSSDDEEHTDAVSFNYNNTRDGWVRRMSSTSETPESQHHVSDFLADSEEQKEINDQQDAEGPRGCESSKIVTGVQQGEQLLQRLQLIQQRQDTHKPESQFTQQVIEEVRIEQQIVVNLTEGWDLAGENAKEENRVNAENVNATKTILKVKEVNDSKDQEAKAKMSSSTTQLQDNSTNNSEQSDKWISADVPSTDSYDTSFTHIPFLTCHRFSVAETSMERHVHEVTQRKQNLQRAEGTFNLAENPDVLEIPFKTNITLEPLATERLQNNWQLSEQKMQKDISKDIQREPVLVNQEIPGSYSKGETHQLKDTKLLFEPFHLDKTVGPTRHRKHPSEVRGHISPSVLKCTQSLEMFSVKSCAVSRAHSLNLYKSITAEIQKSQENLRLKSPNGGCRDKTRLYPYPKQEIHKRLYRSMDSISADGSTAVDTKRNTQNENTGVESPILKQNPFFKLRPSLSLQPEVERDIREAKKREEELRRQRKALYGENRQNSEDEEKPTFTSVQDVRHQPWGKLERVWPPPPKKDQVKSEQSQQETKLQRAGGQKAALWQRWESGQINRQTSKENN